jgi:hypothetical protein
LEIDPRFPMFGGWKADFIIGYSLPAQRVLSYDKDHPNVHVLNISFGTAFTQSVVDRSTLRIILPEGATDIKYIAPFPVDEEEFEKRFTYLDTSGRPVLVLRSKNLCKYHHQYVQVIYSFPPLIHLKEPLMLSLMMFGIMAIVMCYARIDLSLSGTKSRAQVVPSGSDDSLDKEQLGALAKQLSDQLNNLKNSYTTGQGANASSAAIVADITRVLEQLRKSKVYASVVEKALSAVNSVQSAGNNLLRSKGQNEAQAAKKSLQLRFSEAEQTFASLNPKTS